LTPFECKYQIVPSILWVLIDANEDSIMVDDATTPSNLSIMPIKEEEFKETLFTMNVSQ